MQNLTTWDLGTLENSFDFLEDLPRWDVRCLEFDDGTRTDEWYFRDEKNARVKFEKLAKEHGLTVKGNWWKNERGKQLRMGKIPFED